MKIHVLDDKTINQIAAGEVIENPSSVVKELLDNAIDAGASEIIVEIISGGRQLIRVSDNGCGMDEEDALLSLERHATSKLMQLDDLFSLKTMGFRGEAIPSIAAISKMSILTSIDGKKATLVLVEGGKIIKVSSGICAQGTTVEVKSLFYNVPVRKKFQKSPAYDAQEVMKMVSLLALAYPEKKFKLISDHKNLIHAPFHEENIFQSRVKEILGEDFLKECCPIEVDQGLFQLSGFIGKPSFFRPNRKGQFLFVNKRPISSLFISYAVKEGYGTLLPMQKYPLFALHLAISPEEIDVNVHPQKKEIRIRQESILKETIIRAVEKAFHQKEEKSFFQPSSYPKGFLQEEIEYPPFDLQMDFPRSVQEEPATFFSNRPTYKVKFSMPGYLIVEKEIQENGLTLIDQRAAHTRIIFERLSSAFAEQKEIASEALLIPKTLSFSPKDADLLRKNMKVFHCIGIGIREFGPHTFILEALPDFLEGQDISSFIASLLEELNEYQTAGIIQREKQKKLAELAARQAISSTKKLSLEEGQELVEQLMKCKSPYNAPKGNPTLITLTKEDLAKLFNEK